MLTILEHLARLVSERVASIVHDYRVERELEGLSFDMRKDIGFRS